jgi:eukaryotic-like serine/threonine-protein kinase
MTLEAFVQAVADRYHIERELGQGGMATVYLAQDLRHDRRVAVKVLRPELAAVIGGDRFLSEIKTTANLQHPHILPLFDSGAAGGSLFYVMPFIEGESLRDRLTREKQLPIADAVRIAMEVAGALDYAHRHGVIHRDIKPENILLHDGRALVADFGIALAASKAGGTRMTETGMSLGTPHYMSPEQATGEKEITPAADIYALGCVLYEMLTGEPPFTGPTAQAVVAKLLTSDPEPVTTLRKAVPPYVEAAVETALQKLPADRFQSAKAFGDALGDSLAGARTPSRRAAAARGAGRSQQSLYVMLALCALFFVVALIGWLRPRGAAETSRQRVVLWQYSLGQMLDPGLAREATQATIAPDGSSIVYVDSGGGHLQLLRKLRSASVAAPIAGTEGALSPFFSPDGHWIGFSTADGSLKKVPIEGGGAVSLAHRSDPTYSAAAWLDDGTIVYGGGVGLYAVNADGGASRPLLPDTSRERATALTISALPGSRGVLYTACPDNCSIQSAIHVFDLNGHSDRMLVADAAGAWYSPTGHLLYTDRAGGLYAVRFDLDRLSITSGPVSVIDGVVPGSFTMTRSGTALYTTTTAAGTPAELVWVARDGSAVPFDSTWRGDFQYPALSPNGRTLAVSVRDGTTQLWVHRSDGARQRLTEEGTTNWRPAWSPDGKSIAFSSNRRGGPASRDVFNLYEVPADGSAPATLLLHHVFGIWEGEFSPDGRWLLMRSDEQNNISHIYGRRLTGDTALVPLVVDTSISYQIALSPDGRWLAYCGYATGRAEIYVAPFPGMRPTRLVSRDGGSEPRWAHSGRELFYRSGSRFMAVPLTPGPALTLSTPRELFSAATYRAARNRQEYDVAPDDRHFVMIRDVPGSANVVMYVENWFPELGAKLQR